MRRPASTLDVLRPLSGLVLLVVFLGAAQLAPVTHLASHRNDHTHGPEGPGAVPPRGADAGHTHGPGAAHRHDGAPAAHDHDGTTVVDHDHQAGSADDAGHSHSPASPAAPGEHGRGSSAHFGLALIEGPPSLSLPAPVDAVAPPCPCLPRRHASPPSSPPSARGPPRLA